MVKVDSRVPRIPFVAICDDDSGQWLNVCSKRPRRQKSDLGKFPKRMIQDFLSAAEPDYPMWDFPDRRRFH
jgi:hypothetical protein